MVEVYVSLCSLGIIFILCVLGIFYEKYNDNWGQRIGLILVGMASVLLVRLIWERQWVSPEAFWFILGATIFGMGTAVKVASHRRNKEQKTFHLKQRG